MAALAGALRGDLDLNSSQFDKGMTKAAGQVNKLDQAFGALGNKGIAKANSQMTGFLTSLRGGAQLAVAFGIGAFIKDSIEGAKATEDMQRKLETAFGGMAGNVEEWASTTSDALGQVDDNLKESALSLGVVFTAAAKTQGQAAQLSEQFATLAVDLARFKGIKPEEAAEALQKGLQGATRGLKQFGVSITDQQVAQRAVQMGLASTTDHVSEQAKVLARANLIWEQTSKLQGYAAKNMNSATAQGEKFKKVIDDLSDAFGALLLPALTATLGVINSIVQAWNNGFGEIGNQLGLFAARVKFGNEAVDAALASIEKEKAANAAAAAALKAHGGALEDLSDAAKVATESNSAYINSAKSLEHQVTQLGGGLGDYRDALYDINQTSAQLTVEITKQIKELQSQEVQTEGTARAVQILQGALKRIPAATKQATEGLEQITAAQLAMQEANDDASHNQSQQRIKDFQQSSGHSGVINDTQSRMLKIEADLAQERLDNAAKEKELIAANIAAQFKKNYDEATSLAKQLADQQEYSALVEKTTASQILAQQDLEATMAGARGAVGGALSDLRAGLFAGGAGFDFKEWAATFVTNLGNALTQTSLDGLTDWISDLLGFSGKKTQEVQTINASTLNVSGGLGDGKGSGGAVGGLLGKGIDWAAGLFGAKPAAAAPQTTGGGIGGLFASALGAFTGPHEMGGFIPPGKWGTAGEAGTEPVFGGRTGATVIPHGAMGGNSTVINIVTENRDSFRSSERQTAREVRRTIGAN